MLRFVYQSTYHPQLPIAVWEFLLAELKLGRKYVIMTMGLGAERIMRHLLQHTRVVCALETNEEKRQYLNNQLDTFSNFLPLQATPEKNSLQEDTLDGVFLVHPDFDIRSEIIQKEMKRVLRLNSYVVLAQHKILAPEGSFAQAYLHFIQQYNEKQQDPYSSDFQQDALATFFADGFQSQTFPNQLRLDFEGLSGYYLGSEGAYEEQHPKHSLALKALKILFTQYQSQGQVALDFETQLYYGLFNKYVPAISLRKSLFFNVLRPFAFGFYVLVKMNIYFWRIIYKIKEWMFGKKA